MLQAPCRANEIGKSSYDQLVGIQNCTAHRVCRIQRSNGSHKYFTYHLISGRY